MSKIIFLAGRWSVVCSWIYLRGHRDEVFVARYENILKCSTTDGDWENYLMIGHVKNRTNSIGSPQSPMMNSLWPLVVQTTSSP